MTGGYTTLQLPRVPRSPVRGKRFLGSGEGDAEVFQELRGVPADLDDAEEEMSWPNLRMSHRGNSGQVNCPSGVEGKGDAPERLAGGVTQDEPFLRAPVNTLA